MDGDPGSRRSTGAPRRPLRVAVVDGWGRPVRRTDLARWMSGLVPRRVHGEVTVALLSDRRVRALNRRYRRTDRITDVLSFPAVREDPGGPGALGDIAIAVGVARRQARQAGHPLGTELRILALHGLLHLIGYDHEAPSDRGAMARIERRWRRRAGLPDGLIDRAGDPGRAHRASRATGGRGA